MKASKKIKMSIIVGLISLGVGTLALSNIDSNGSELGLIKLDDDIIEIIGAISKDDIFIGDVTNKSSEFAKVMNSAYISVGTKTKLNYKNKFFLDIVEGVDTFTGVNYDEISLEKWLSFYENANNYGVDKYLKDSKEHTLSIKLDGTVSDDDMFKFVRIDSIMNYEPVKSEIEEVEMYGIDQYLIAGNLKRIFIRDGSEYREASENEKKAIIALDNKIKLDAEMALRYHALEDSNTYDLKVIEFYNENSSGNTLYHTIKYTDVLSETLNLVNKIKVDGKYLMDKDIDYTEMNDLFSWALL